MSCPTCNDTGKVREIDRGGEYYYENCTDCRPRTKDRPWHTDLSGFMRLALYLREHDPMSSEDREWERLREIAEKPWKWNGEFDEMLGKERPPT